MKVLDYYSLTLYAKFNLYTFSGVCWRDHAGFGGIYQIPQFV